MKMMKSSILKALRLLHVQEIMSCHSFAESKSYFLFPVKLWTMELLDSRESCLIRDTFDSVSCDEVFVLRLRQWCNSWIWSASSPRGLFHRTTTTARLTSFHTGKKTTFFFLSLPPQIRIWLQDGIINRVNIRYTCFAATRDGYKCLPLICHIYYLYEPWHIVILHEMKLGAPGAAAFNCECVWPDAVELQRGRFIRLLMQCHAFFLFLFF